VTPETRFLEGMDENAKRFCLAQCDAHPEWSQERKDGYQAGVLAAIHACSTAFVLRYTSRDYGEQ
jgi:hypothetical protein